MFQLGINPIRVTGSSYSNRVSSRNQPLPHDGPPNASLRIDLCDLAREAWAASGLTQVQAAEQLGVKHPTFARAVGNPESSLTALRRRIVEAFTPYRVDGPQYVLVKKGEASA